MFGIMSVKLHRKSSMHKIKGLLLAVDFRLYLQLWLASRIRERKTQTGDTGYVQFAILFFVFTEVAAL